MRGQNNIPSMDKTIIYISPGPNYNSHDSSYQRHWEQLSMHFKGYIFTTSPKSEKFQIGNFNYLSIKVIDYNIKSSILFGLFCIRKAYNISKKKKIDLVATYDPLKTGLIGTVCAFISGAKFAPEINGVYTSPAEWIDDQDKLTTRLKKNIYPVVMHFVLSRAHGARLLFKNQIALFKRVVQGKIIKNFSRFVDTDLFVPNKEKKEILFTGFPFKRKGVDVLIKAFKLIAPKYPDWKLKILGWYPDPAKLNKAIGGHKQIFHQPPVLHEEMPAQIGSCAILVLPSRSEAMGRVLLEAMAAGKPRIGSNVDGIPTVINDGVDGLLCEPDNIENLANKLDLLMGDSALRKKMGVAGRKRAKEEFSEKVYLNNLVNFYNDVIES